MATKIFVFGSVNGQLKSAFAKLATLQAKNNFAFAVVAGNLFTEADDDSVAALLNGTLKVPLPTYFTVGSTPLPPQIVEKIVAEEEICENLHYLNKRSVTKTSEGVRIATLGGLLDTNIAGQSKEHHLPFHTADDAKALRGVNSADILLTTTWPAAVSNGSRVNLTVDPTTIPSSETVADLCAALKPKYHFAMNTSDVFYEREAFFHPPKSEGETSFDITRFLSLASFGNSSKAKAMYAFTLQTETVSILPTGTTVSPFYKSGPRKRTADEAEGYSRFAREDDGDRRNNKRRRNDRNRSPPPGPDRCFFCLSNPNLPTHMVCTIGEDAYIATAKGPLPSAQTFQEQGLNFPAHMIIVPLTHAPTLTTKHMGPEAEVTFKECTRFRESLQAMVSSLSKHKLGTVSWEISRERGIHPHWQVMPISTDMIKKGLVEAAFQVEAENTKLPKLEERDFGLGDEIEGDYFRVWIHAENDDENGGSIISKCLLMRFDQSVRFDLQFGRKVMAKLLGLDKRFQWRDCVQTEQEEKQDADAIREAFKPWDFTA
ncbi:cwfJ domain-containing protein [Pyricularia oryzae 70-15]|uniref:CwfJ domain-containing protein n=1 Tax=Pyricularia oryzae (strain 70-15 / ATCC MYA-4617 / FGSC 8958) TaxID=242507 RepID=G4N0L7_PYRO7|nr:cwfJ domain-containing protein [Pyricularia oryzae 70-15]EHA53148.1 cwfJ domain-containing protein [Pyricularia oryzae 70-15]KAI7912410.1 cwfJ domain-containing protein [Pyricularia oryzae]KAI7923561.1 cwfJ domain-containing protein [Pyricularia oryzae]